ncbi:MULTISPECIES: hypothetical protein [unclassified Nonomuraea]|uniref:hypothetical protein n=1 Tax=unclassified Nonomuraea TaxID=2593643 RepID=UPI0033F0D845
MTIPKDHLEIRHRGGSDVQIKLGSRNLTPALRSVDIYFRADQTPEVVLRPVVTEWGTALDGAKLTISADVALILEAAGWASPERVKALEEDRWNTAKAHGQDVEALEEARKQLATMEEDLANTHGKLADLELANQTLHDELEESQRESSSRKIPY